MTAPCTHRTAIDHGDPEIPVVCDDCDAIIRPAVTQPDEPECANEDAPERDPAYWRERAGWAPGSS